MAVDEFSIYWGIDRFVAFYNNHVNILCPEHQLQCKIYYFALFIRLLVIYYTILTFLFYRVSVSQQLCVHVLYLATKLNYI